MGTIFVDPAALRTAAQRLDAAADILAGTLSTHLRGLHPGDGVGRIITDVAQWSRAARDAADTLRFGADRYSAGESAAAAALR